jgi:predicted O-methyltransferase YrrM
LRSLGAFAGAGFLVRLRERVQGAEGSRTEVKEEGLPDTKPDWRTHGITNEAVEDYVYDLLPPRDEVLAHIEAEAARRHIPIVGPAVARILYQLALMTQAKNIFEMGSAVGYSTIWWARAVGEGGRVIYTDGSRENANEARGYFEKAGLSRRVTLRVGDALEILSEQKQQFDVIFNDVDKEDYPRALRVALPRLRKGGLFVTDNVLWSGKVTGKHPREASTEAILEFNRLLYGSADLFATILPVRDGLAVAVKL